MCNRMPKQNRRYVSDRRLYWKTEEDTEVDIDDDIETDDTKKEEKDEFVSDFEEGSPEYLFEQFLRGDIDAKPFQLKKNVLK